MVYTYVCVPTLTRTVSELVSIKPASAQWYSRSAFNKKVTVCYAITLNRLQTASYLRYTTT